MCGCFTQKYTWRELVELYRLTQPARNLEPRYNVAPHRPHLKQIILGMVLDGAAFPYAPLKRSDRPF